MPIILLWERHSAVVSRGSGDVGSIAGIRQFSPPSETPQWRGVMDQRGDPRTFTGVGEAVDLPPTVPLRRGANEMHDEPGVHDRKWYVGAAVANMKMAPAPS